MYSTSFMMILCIYIYNFNSIRNADIALGHIALLIVCRLIVHHYIVLHKCKQF